MIKLICCDVEGVLVNSDSFWMKLHDAYGTLEEGKALTAQYLHTDYSRLVDEVCGRLWKGKPRQPYVDLVKNIAYNQNIARLFAELARFQHNGKAVPRMLVSAGSYEVCERIKNDFGIDFIFANQLVFEDGFATGQFRWPVGNGGATKAAIIQEVCDDLEILPCDALMIGDSETDREAMELCGISIAFNTKNEAVKKAATYVIEGNDLAKLADLLKSINRAS